MLVETSEGALPEQNPATENVQSQLERRQKAAATTVAGFMIATVLLSVVSFFGKKSFRQQNDGSLDTAVRITIFVFGVGSVAWRRTKFSTLRLQDIGALQGPTGLLSTLEKTTLQIAFLGATIAAIGFIATLLTGNDFYTYGAGVIAEVILIYCYPTRTSWQRAVERFATFPDTTPAV